MSNVGQEYVTRTHELAIIPRPRLAHLDIELTERCDNRCIHCCINQPAGDAAALAHEMSTDQVKNILRQACDLGCLQVRLTGGEPLLRPDFEDIYLFARQLGLKVQVFTNGRRIDSHLADLWNRVPPLMPVEVTVYGMHPESYEAVSRVPGSYRQFRNGVDLLLARKIPTVVKGVVLPPNRHEISELDAWCRTTPGMNGLPQHSLLLDLRHRRDDPAKNEVVLALRLLPEEVLSVLTRDETKYRSDTAEFARAFMRPLGDRLFRCGIGNALSIDAYGRAQPCIGLRAPELSIDVLDSALVNALERYSELREMKATDPEYLSRCAQCVLGGLCEQCPAKSWAEHGVLDKPVEYLCEVAHAQAHFMGWLPKGRYAWQDRVLSRTE